jgi:hypothetical protein
MGLFFANHGVDVTYGTTSSPPSNDRQLCPQLALICPERAQLAILTVEVARVPRAIRRYSGEAPGRHRPVSAVQGFCHSAGGWREHRPRRVGHHRPDRDSPGRDSPGRASARRARTLRPAPARPGLSGQPPPGQDSQASPRQARTLRPAPARPGLSGQRPPGQDSQASPRQARTLRPAPARPGLSGQPPPGQDSRASPRQARTLGPAPAGSVGGLSGGSPLGAGLQRSIYRIVGFSLNYLHRSVQ